MKFQYAAALAALAPSVSAHYFWDKLILNGKETNSHEFVRASTRATAYNPIKWKNVRDNSTPDLDDIRCNQGAFSTASKTKTAEVKAGDNVGFKLAVGATMQHPGPALAYLSKAPGAANQYKGDGEWVKIFETGVCDKSKDFTKDAWCTYDKDTVTFDIPKDVPNGEYLLRVEHIGLHGAHDGQAEFYPACAQIKVTGGSESGSLGSGIKLPGGYKPTDPSFDFSLWSGYKDYPMPGGALYKGVQSGSGSSSGGSSGNNNTEPQPAPVPTSVTAPVPTTLSSAIAAPTATLPPANGGGNNGSFPGSGNNNGGFPGFPGGAPPQAGNGNGNFPGFPGAGAPPQGSAGGANNGQPKPDCPFGKKSRRSKKARRNAAKKNN